MLVHRAVELALLNILISIRSTAFRLNYTRVASSVELTQELYDLLHVLLVQNGEQKVVLSAKTPGSIPPSINEIMNNLIRNKAVRKDLGEHSLHDNYDNDVSESDWVMEKTQTSDYHRQILDNESRENLLNYINSVRFFDRVRRVIRPFKFDLVRRDERNYNSRSSFWRKGPSPRLPRRPVEEAEAIRSAHASTVSKRWSSSTTKMENYDNQRRELPEIYRDVCRSFSTFEIVKVAINDALQSVEVLPNTWVWTTKCSQPDSSCSTIAPGVVAKCRQKQAWVQAFARLHENDPWRWHWIAVDNSCNCGLRMQY